VLRAVEFAVQPRGPAGCRRINTAVPAGRLRVKRIDQSPEAWFRSRLGHFIHWRKADPRFSSSGTNPARPLCRSHAAKQLCAAGVARSVRARGLLGRGAALQFGGIEDQPKRSICALHSLFDLLEPVRTTAGRSVRRSREADSGSGIVGQRRAPLVAVRASRQGQLAVGWMLASACPWRGRPGPRVAG